MRFSVNNFSSKVARYFSLVPFLVGISLSISQFIMIRDFVSILYGEEVVIVLVTSSFFLGLSIGYFLSLKLDERAFKILFAVSALFHLTFPFSYRYAAVWISAQDLGGAFYMAFLWIYSLIFSSIFAAFLPRLISLGDDSMSPVEKLRLNYSSELLGFVTGFAFVGMSMNKPVVFLLPIYWLFLGWLLHLVLRNLILTGAYFLLMMPLIMNLSRIDIHTASLVYSEKHGKKNAKVLYSVNSPYQKVEVVESSKGELYLYLDGLMNLNSSDLEDLNYFIASVPVQLTKPANTLVIGNGTLSSISKVYPYSGNVVSVELDSGVIAAGLEYFTDPASLAKLDRWKLIVDDGKHFLKTTETRFDLIIMDIPSPLTIQEAALHTSEFYQLAHDRLTDDGVISVQLSGPLKKNNRTPSRVVASLAEVFKEVMVVDSPKADRSFAYASDDLPFSRSQVRKLSIANDPNLKIISPDQTRSFLTKAIPLTLDTMDLVLKRGLERFMDRYFYED